MQQERCGPCTVSSSVAVRPHFIVHQCPSVPCPCSPCSPIQPLPAHAAHGACLVVLLSNPVVVDLRRKKTTGGEAATLELPGIGLRSQQMHSCSAQLARHRTRGEAARSNTILMLRTSSISVTTLPPSFSFCESPSNSQAVYMCATLPVSSPPRSRSPPCRPASRSAPPWRPRQPPSAPACGSRCQTCLDRQNAKE